MTDDRTTTRTRDRDWTGDEWAGTPDASRTTGEGAPDTERWNKTEWVGDQGGGRPPTVDPATMPEGDTAISGDRHAPGEQHWARGKDAPPEAGDPDAARHDT